MSYLYVYMLHNTIIIHYIQLYRWSQFGLFQRDLSSFGVFIYVHIYLRSFCRISKRPSVKTPSFKNKKFILKLVKILPGFHINSKTFKWSCNQSIIWPYFVAPCAPASVSKFLHCDTNMLSVTWALSPMALSYSVLVKPINGLVRGCSSPGTSCNVSGLQCGLSYTLTVMAANKVCTGPESPSQIIQTGTYPSILKCL